MKSEKLRAPWAFRIDAHFSIAMVKRLAIIVSHPIQHFSPVYRVIGRNRRIEVVVIYYSDSGAKQHFDKDFNTQYQWDIDLLAGYRSVVLKPGALVSGVSKLQMDAPEIVATLDQEKPDAVLVYGYAHRFQWRAMRWAKINRKQLLYFSDSTLIGYSRAWWRVLLKDIPLRHFFRQVDTFLGVGDRNLAYLAHYGAPDGRIRRCPLSVDIERFNETQLKGNREQLRAAHGIGPNEFAVVFSGKFIPRKRPLDLVQATISLRRKGIPVKAILIGSGPMAEEVTARCQEYPEAFKLPGFVNQVGITELYYASDALALPSERDAHPLVATEAAACGLPLVVSDHVGCIGPTDVVRDGINGIVYKCGEVDQLAGAIEKLYRCPEIARAYGVESRKIAATQDIHVAAKAMEEAVIEWSPKR